MTRAMVRQHYVKRAGRQTRAHVPSQPATLASFLGLTCQAPRCAPHSERPPSEATRSPGIPTRRCASLMCSAIYPPPPKVRVFPHGGGTFQIEPDASSASYFHAVNALFQP